MGKNFYIVTTIAVVVLLGVLGFVFKDQIFGNESNVNKGRIVPVIATATDSEFSLKADNYDALGIYPGTSFTLTAKNQVEKSEIEGNLMVEPDFKYKIESSDNNEFSILPEETLNDNTIYKFSMTGQQAGEDKIKEYQWAYQTKSTFKIMSTLPADEATYVPVDTGIEINFSHENFINYDQYFHITPAVNGSFEKHRKTLVFVPESLDYGILYTVTLDKDLPLSGTDEVLDQAYTFQFETEDDRSNNNRINFSENFYEYPTDQAPVLDVSEYNSGLTSINIEVYSFPSFDDFTSAVDTLNDYPMWAYNARQKNIYPTDQLDMISSFSADIQNQDYEKYIEFPENLPLGYYLVQTTNNGKTSQAYLQSVNLIASFQGTDKNSFIWMHDLVTGQPLSGATVGFSHDATFSAKADSEGLAEFDTPDEISSDSYYDLDGIYYYTVDFAENNLLVPVEGHYEFGGWRMGGNTSREYWTYLYTNRTLYAPSDSIKFWGVIKSRQDNSAKTVTVQLVRQANYNNGNKETTISKQILEVGSYGTFEGTFDYQNLPPSGYSIKILVDDEVIMTKWVNIQQFTKPRFKLEVESDKKAYFEGEDVIFNVKSVYYDGTPLGNMELEYTGDLGTGLITTDDSGEATVTLASSYSSSSYYPKNTYFSVHPTLAETTDIYTDAYVYLFGPNIDLAADMDKDNVINGYVYDVDLTTINNDSESFAWNYEGDPVPGVVVNAEIYHEYYTKTETGTRYDFINKKTYKTYDYKFNSDLVGQKQVTSGPEGKFSLPYNYVADKKYKIVLSITDGSGRTATTQVYKYTENFGSNYYSAQGFDSYSLTYSGETVVQPGTDITLDFYKNDEKLDQTNDKDFLYFKGMGGIFDLTTSKNSDYEFEFTDSYAPNIYLYGIYFDGRHYNPTQALRLDYDTSLKKLNIDISTDQANYEPGAEVNMDITVTDVDGQPVKSTVNVSAIDEALTAIQWNNTANFLSSLYTRLPLTLDYSYQSHKELAAPMAEGGGCFTGDTQIMMSDRSTKSIEDVKIGDSILTRAAPDDNTLVPAKVINYFQHLVNDYLVINNSLEITPEHIVLLNGQWQTAGQAVIGDQLTDTSGQQVVINSIKLVSRPTLVYNLHVEKYHTFIADNIYVHNDKGGGRTDFQDIAYFGSVETDNQGRASLTFKLPDNVTSWQTTVHALTSDLKASSSQTAVIATLPFFVDVTLAKDYIVGDKPIVRLRSAGLELNPNAEVKYTVSYPDYDGAENTYETKGNEWAEVALPELPAGNYSMRIKAEQGSYEDTIVKEFSFNTSNLMTGSSNYFLLTEDTDLTGNDEGYTDVTFSNKESGQYYNILRRLRWQHGDRIDQRLARYYADKILMDYFHVESDGNNDFDFSTYQQPEGGISLLPYSSAEILLTAKAVEIAGDNFSDLGAADYFYGIINNEDSNMDEVVYALFGLANLHKPVLTEINLLLDNNDVPDKLKIYLSRGLANLGATEYGAGILQGILDEYGEESDNYIKVALGEDQDEYTEYTWQSAIVLSQVSSDKAYKFFDYAMDNPATDQLNFLEELAYINYALPLLSEDPVSFSYILDGQSQEVVLEKNDKLTLSLDKDQRESITFSDISGNVGVVTSYQVPMDLSTVEVDPDISLTREYSVDGNPTTNFQVNDIVKVTLQPNISNEAIDNYYQLVDYLPSGLKVISNLKSRNIGWDDQTRYPYAVDGQAVKFSTSKTTLPFHYYAMVIGQGDFVAEPTVLQGFTARDSLNYGTQSAINIE